MFLIVYLWCTIYLLVNANIVTLPAPSKKNGLTPLPGINKSVHNKYFWVSKNILSTFSIFKTVGVRRSKSVHCELSMSEEVIVNLNFLSRQHVKLLKIVVDMEKNEYEILNFNFLHYDVKDVKIISSISSHHSPTPAK